jgi:hypothetical protein
MHAPYMARSALLCGLALSTLVGCGGAVEPVEQDRGAGSSAGAEASLPLPASTTDRVGAPKATNPVDEGSAGESSALATCEHRFRGGGRVSAGSGCFTWGGTPVPYVSVGGVFTRSSRTITSPAAAGDDEVLAFGASHGGNDSLDVDTYMDAARMRAEGFRAIGVRGSRDKKVELWVRHNSGEGTVTLPNLAVAYNLVVFQGVASRASRPPRGGLDVDAIRAATVKSANATSWLVPAATGDDLRVLAYFGDDPFEVVDARPGGLTCNTWGFGDGDSLNVLVFGPGQRTPARIPVRRYATGGSQYVGILANFPAK